MAVRITAGDIFGAPVFASKAGTVEIVYTGCENHNAATTLIGCSADITKCSCNNLRKSNTYNIMLCNYTMGNAVIIKHPETDAQGKDISKYSQYLHLSSIAPDIVVGKNVRQGEVIGYVGSTGESTGTHLHFSLSNSTKAADRFNNNRGVIDYGDSVLVYKPEVVKTVSDVYDLEEDFERERSDHIERGLPFPYQTLDELIADTAQKYERGY